MRILEVGVAGDIEVRPSPTVDTPWEDGIELWRLGVLDAFPTLGRRDAGITVNNLFVLDQNLKETGKVTGFARNESIKAVRYIGELEDTRKRRLMQPKDACIGVVSKF